MKFPEKWTDKILICSQCHVTPVLNMQRNPPVSNETTWRAISKWSIENSMKVICLAAD